MKVYKAIANVMLDLSKEGVSKDKKNVQQNYAFRGIDDMYNALAPLLAKHGLVILPQVIGREVTEKQSKSGAILFYTVVCVEFMLVCAEDGSSHKVITYGEAMDSGDKSTNKAMSSAYKYAVMQSFCIPTEGDNDADATTTTVTNEIKMPATKVATPTSKAPTATPTSKADREVADRILDAIVKPTANNTGLTDEEALIGASYLCILDGLKNKDAVVVQETCSALSEEQKKLLWAKLNAKEKTEARILLAKKLDAEA